MQFSKLEVLDHYQLGRFVGEDSVGPVSFSEYFRGSTGKDRVHKYDSETMKKIDG
jgi:hypothetical protein